MKIAVASDSHFQRPRMMSMAEDLRNIKDLGAFIHLGDVEPDADWFRERLTVPVYSVPGNCDMKPDAPPQVVITLDGVRLMLCHGHVQRVKYTLDNLAYRAMELQVSAALFGHTHKRCMQNAGGVLLINPGALANGDYAIIETENGGIGSVKFCDA